MHRAPPRQLRKPEARLCSRGSLAEDGRRWKLGGSGTPLLPLFWPKGSQNNPKMVPRWSQNGLLSWQLKGGFKGSSHMV